MPGGVECLYELILLHHVGVVAKKVRAAAEMAHEGDDNTPSGATGRGVKNPGLLVSKLFWLEDVGLKASQGTQPLKGISRPTGRYVCACSMKEISQGVSEICSGNEIISL